MIAQDDLFTLSTAAEAVETPDAARRRIDAMSYEEMLRMVRNSPLTHPLFRGKVGIHFHAVMKEKRHAIPDKDRAEIHVRVGY